MPRIIKHSRVVSAEAPALIPDAVFVMPYLPEEFAEPPAEDSSGDLPLTHELSSDGEAQRRIDDYEAALREEIYGQIAEEANALATERSQKLLSEARAEAEKILESARIQKAEILERAELDAQMLVYETRAETEKAVREECEQSVLDSLNSVDKLLDTVRDELEIYFENCEQQLKYLAIEIAEKVLHTHISENGTALAELVKDAVGSVKNVEWISVEVSDKLVVLIHKLRKEFPAGEISKNIEVRPKDIPIDSCIVKTNEGIIDASVSTQLANLREIFEELDEQKL